MPAESVTACLFSSYDVRNRPLTAVLSSIVSSFCLICKTAWQYNYSKDKSSEDTYAEAYCYIKFVLSRVESCKS